MIENEKQLREHMTMKLFNFYLDDLTKLKVIQKLKECGYDTKKGTMSALIRVMLKYFVDLADDTIIQSILENVEEEYTFTTKKNKRSTL